VEHAPCQGVNHVETELKRVTEVLGGEGRVVTACHCLSLFVSTCHCLSTLVNTCHVPCHTGLMLRQPNSKYQAGRNYTLLKVRLFGPYLAQYHSILLHNTTPSVGEAVPRCGSCHPRIFGRLADQSGVGMFQTLCHFVRLAKASTKGR
jgi:hypothetical protein